VRGGYCSRNDTCAELTGRRPRSGQSLRGAGAPRRRGPRPPKRAARPRLGRPVRGLASRVVSGGVCDAEAAWRGAFLAHGSLTDTGRSPESARLVPYWLAAIPDAPPDANHDQPARRLRRRPPPRVLEVLGQDIPETSSSRGHRLPHLQCATRTSRRLTVSKIGGLPLTVRGCRRRPVLSGP
jgi:hypothetical protein